MKKIFSFLILSAILIGFHSCEDHINDSPYQQDDYIVDESSLEYSINDSLPSMSYLEWLDYFDNNPIAASRTRSSQDQHFINEIKQQFKDHPYSDDELEIHINTIGHPL